MFPAKLVRPIPCKDLRSPQPGTFGALHAQLPLLPLERPRDPDDIPVRWLLFPAFSFFRVDPGRTALNAGNDSHLSNEIIPPMPFRFRDVHTLLLFSRDRISSQYGPQDNRRSPAIGHHPRLV